ncbi:translation initiation factor [Theileria orientalis strain Shintoku]|uniref:Translation initiation factor n=1 Tax=Theileria orientalis strain Shintoku TaxID=869250 RepID=J4CDM4_THEOR|nr:translation initiation factor [Theileria orientalis strain Shintoku]BAM41397.1 translation initiation factor [Theileria orientalis strain Shintoku]|eukprot:XP_009691698.1 translation initiation factor [Theileria orientalis strain Shintoku]
MSNGGNLVGDLLKNVLKNGSYKQRHSLKSLLEKPVNRNYNPNHTDSNALIKLKNDINSLKIKQTLLHIIDKPVIDTFGVKDLFNVKSSKFLNNNTHNIVSQLKQGEIPINSFVDEEAEDISDAPKTLDNELEVDLLRYEGCDRKFLKNYSRVLSLLKSQNHDLCSELELKVKEFYESMKDAISTSHISLMLRHIYRENKNIEYEELLENICRVLNDEELRSLYSYNWRTSKWKLKRRFSQDRNLEEEVESLLHSIQTTNASETIFSRGVGEKEVKYMDECEGEGPESTIEYGKKNVNEKNEKIYVSILSSESLSRLTKYEEGEITEICNMLDLNVNKLTVEEGQFILDEISTLKNKSVPGVDEKYEIVEKNGKYCVELLKSNWVKRPIVVTVMGHVDHGKTSLLDYIHKTEVAKNEKGYITQKLSTFQIRSNEGRITFIDTPGHAAFMTMRKRGVSCTDLVILVVAADDGIMPQTLECIDLIKRNGLKVVVAINKVDLAPEEAIAKIEEDVRSHFSKATIVQISAKSGHNIEALLSEIEKVQKKMEYKMDKNAIFKGYIYETIQDQTRGKCINIIVNQGTLKPNDYVLIKDTIIKVKKIYHPDSDNKHVMSSGERVTGKSRGESRENESDDHENIIQLSVSMNVCSLAGNVVVGNSSLKQLQKYQYLINKHVANQGTTGNEDSSQDQTIPFIGINLRCADQGSLEAIENYIHEFNEKAKKTVNMLNLVQRNYLPPEVTGKSESESMDEKELRAKYEEHLRAWTPFKVISKNLGNFNTNDLQLQQIGNVINIGFNVQNHINLSNIVRTHDIIYNIFNDLQVIYQFYFGDLYRKKVESNLIVTQLGTITLKGVGKKQAVGTSVKEGQSKLNHLYSVVRNNKQVYSDLNILSFQSNKMNVKLLSKGDNNNCLIFKENVEVQLNDEIVAYVKQPLMPLFDTVTNHLLKT